MRFASCCLALLLAVLTGALAQDGAEDRRARIAQIERSLDQAEDLPDQALVDWQEELRTLRREVELAAAPLQAQLETLRDDLERLGPEPEEGAPAEDSAIAQRRSEIEASIGRVNAALRQAELNSALAGRLVDEIAERRREAFTGALLRRGPSPVDPRVLGPAADTLLAGTDAARDAFGTWIAEKQAAGALNDAILSIVVAIALAVALFLPIRSWINNAIKRRIANLEPLPSRRVLVATVRTLARTVPGLLGGFFVYEALRLNGAIPPGGEAFARAIWVGFLTLLFADGAVNAVFAPRLPAWRVAPLSNRGVLAVRSVILSAAIVLAGDLVLRMGAEVFADSAALALVQEGLVAITLAVLLFLLCRDGMWRRGSDEPTLPAEPEALTEGDAPPGAPEAPAVTVPAPRAIGLRVERSGWTQIRRAGQIISILAAGAAILGFVSLGHYLVTRSFALLALFGLVWALRALMREAVRLFDRRFSSEAQVTADREERVLYSWIGIGIDLLALIVFIPPALLILGAEPADVRGWLSDAFFGFEVGAVRISVAKILAGITVFFGLLWLTRTVQRATDTRVFPRSRLDAGVQNSLRTLIGYVGLIIAFAAGVGTLGFDLGNLAIIAGALSVGIGFGLQSIVNNFVSGLILLFERPIKVGDWIVTNSGEGIVKRISVRSTEIETFDRSSVIVPNSELISGAVTNWTHKDRMGRLVIAVGAAYSSDAAQVVRVLEDVALRSPDVLSDPAPLVVFEDFGASSLDFTLRTYIRDVSDTLKVRTRLRIAIHARFAEEGIEIPFPQRDLHLRDLPDHVLQSGHGPAAAAAE
ncbi:DUF3772 domain-containing protein [Parvularcula oceani]|uniref:DUF3772 domain-containing protein n=1 Tax=Parvularcula oceani TaxID=1247963 RepID=UPI0004E26412|nr:DUF3772 domain-containing protein [Parvularcula oceani]